MHRERREFFRHPISVPLRVREAQNELGFSCVTKDISLGGLNFSWDSKIPKGSLIVLTIPVREKSFDVRAKVAYSREGALPARFEIGAQFLDAPSAFRARLAEEVIQILEFRKKISKDLGREISEEDAARQWVSKHASHFPQLSPAPAA